MHSIICTSSVKKSDLSIAGFQTDPFEGDWQDEPFEPTFADTAYFDPDDEVDLYSDFGSVMRLSEAWHDPFWTYFDRFVRYWPKMPFHVKYAYEKGFVEKKRKHTGNSLLLFEELAVEITERHLCSATWSQWKGVSYPDDPIWLGLHMPKSTTVDLIDVDAKQYRVGYYRENGDRKARLLPVINIPLEHFKMLKAYTMPFQDVFGASVRKLSNSCLEKAQASPTNCSTASDKQSGSQQYRLTGD